MITQLIMALLASAYVASSATEFDQSYRFRYFNTGTEVQLVSEGKETSLVYESLEYFYDDETIPNEVNQATSLFIVPYSVTIARDGDNYSASRIRYLYSTSSVVQDFVYFTKGASTGPLYPYGNLAPWAIMVYDGAYYVWGDIPNLFQGSIYSWSPNFTLGGVPFGYSDHVWTNSTANWYWQTSSIRSEMGSYLTRTLPLITKKAYDEGYTAGMTANNGKYSVSEYQEYGEQRFQEGKRTGYNEGYTDGSSQTAPVFDIIGGIVSVPLYILNGLSAFTIWDISIISIIVTLLMVALVIWLIARLLGR